MKYLLFCLFGVGLNFRGRAPCKFQWLNAVQAPIQSSFMTSDAFVSHFFLEMRLCFRMCA